MATSHAISRRRKPKSNVFFMPPPAQSNPCIAGVTARRDAALPCILAQRKSNETGRKSLRRKDLELFADFRGGLR
jgi:hypothetical protein